MKRFRSGCSLAVSTLLTFAAVASAAAETAGFRAPSGNIHCMYFADGDATSLLRCDIIETDNAPPERPADCDVDWGNAFAMGPGSQHAERICHGDSVADPSLPVLNYGSSWEEGGFSCNSEKVGVSCRNELGAGWDLSRANQKLY